ncbi:MAG: hypothetical protein NDJ94_14670 [Vicinamibacteria bacterium]|nr:hypothetical protein [Vicinamibacteria bacterium]
MRLRSAAALLFALAMLPRVVAVLYVDADPVLSERVLAPDSRSMYLPMAANVVSGVGYHVQVDPTAPLTIPPAYPAWLATLSQVLGREPSPLLIGLLNAVLRAFGVVILLLLAEGIVPRPAAVAAALLYALDPWEAFWTPYVLKESVAVPLLLLAVRAARAAHQAPRPATAATAGFVAATATLAWFGNGVVALWALAGLTRATRARAMTPRGPVLAFVAAAAAVFLPWCAHVAVAVPQESWRHVPDRVLLRFAGRPFVPEARTSGYPPDTDPKVFRPTRTSKRGQPPNPPPSTLLGRLPRNLAAAFVNLWRPAHAGSAPTTLLLFGLPYVVFMGFSLAGLLLAWRERLGLGGLPSLLVAMTVVLLLVTGGVRQRQYLTPLLAVPAGLALARLADLRAVRRVV